MSVEINSPLKGKRKENKEDHGETRTKHNGREEKKVNAMLVWYVNAAVA